jgi:peptidoglycan/LPS O-acetylase OafA/YrhL
MPTITAKYRPDIDGLRCVAVLLVLAFHFELFSGAKGGFVGVDVFFVISGFLISSLIWRELDEGRFSLGGFYLRRFRRLAPAFVTVQLGILAFSSIMLLPQEVPDLAKQSLWAQVYLINFYLWGSVGYFGLGADSIALLHCWSLAIEEQFYLLYPLLLIGIHKFARRSFVPIIAAAAAGSFLLNLGMVHAKPEATFYLLPTRAWELALGALIPYAEPWLEGRSKLRPFVGAAGLGLVALSALAFRPGISYPGSFALLPTLGAAALIASGSGQGSWLSRTMSWKPLVYLGKISYSLYLVHWPLKVFIASYLPTYSLAWRWLSLGLSIALASALYRLVEDPIRRGVAFAGARRFIVAYGIGFSVVVALLVSAVATRGWKGRFSEETLRLADYATDKDMGARGRCEFRTGEWPGPTGPCRIGQANATPNWLVVGDSHGWALMNAFSLFLERRNESGHLAFLHACTPVLGLGERTCQDFNSRIHAWVEAHPEIRNIVLVSIWVQPTEGRMRGPDGTFLEGHAVIGAFQDHLTRTLKRLGAAGRNVYVWETIPLAKMSVPIALARTQAFGWHPRFEPSRTEHEQRFAFMTAALEANRNLIKGTISPLVAMCPNDSCIVEHNGIPLYFDDNHPSLSSAPFFSRIIEDQIGTRSQLSVNRTF